jgi:hypothetical protein
MLYMLLNNKITHFQSFDKQGNSFVYLLRTRTLIRSLTENSESPGIFFEEEEALAGNGERELGLHLAEFTGVILLFVEVIKQCLELNILFYFPRLLQNIVSSNMLLKV